MGQTTQYKIAIMVETIFKELGNKKALNFVDDFKRKLEGVSQLTKYGNVGKKLGMGIKQGTNGLELYNLKSKEVYKNQTEAMQKITNAMNRIKTIPPPFAGKTGAAGFGDVQKMMKSNLMFEELQNNAKKLGFDVQGTANKMSIFQNGVKLTGDKAITAFTDIGRHANKMRGSFDMSYLSIMFFGMALQTLFSGLIKMGIGTYKELTKNNTEASTAVTHLEANFQLLKFTLGEALVAALLPYMDTIIDIIGRVAQWISENQTLVGWIIAIGAALGTAMFILGTFKLGLASIGIKLSELAAGTIIPISIGGLASILGVFLLIWAAWESDLGGLQTFLKETFDGLFGENGAILDIMNEFKDVIKDIFAVIVALFGDDRKEFDTAITKLTINIGEVLLKGLTTVGWLATNALIWIVNSLIDLLSGTLGSLMLDAMQKFAEIMIAPLITLARSFDAFGVLPKGLKSVLSAYDDFTDSMKDKVLKKIDLIPRIDYQTADDLKNKLDDIDKFTDKYRESIGLDKENDYFIATASPNSAVNLQSMIIGNTAEINSLKDEGLNKDFMQISLLEKQNELLREKTNLLNAGNEYQSVFNEKTTTQTEYDRFYTGTY